MSGIACPACGEIRKIEQVCTPDGWVNPDCWSCGDRGWVQPFGAADPFAGRVLSDPADTVVPVSDSLSGTLAYVIVETHPYEEVGFDDHKGPEYALKTEYVGFDPVVRGEINALVGDFDGGAHCSTGGCEATIGGWLDEPDDGPSGARWSYVMFLSEPGRETRRLCEDCAGVVLG